MRIKGFRANTFMYAQDKNIYFEIVAQEIIRPCFRANKFIYGDFPPCSLPPAPFPLLDRILKLGDIPCLGNIIREKSSSNPFGWSWQPE
jgi:hypothetical protein